MLWYSYPTRLTCGGQMNQSEHQYRQTALCAVINMYDISETIRQLKVLLECEFQNHKIWRNK